MLLLWVDFGLRRVFGRFCGLDSAVSSRECGAIDVEILAAARHESRSPGSAASIAAIASSIAVMVAEMRRVEVG